MGTKQKRLPVTLAPLKTEAAIGALLKTKPEVTKKVKRPKAEKGVTPRND